MTPAASTTTLLPLSAQGPDPLAALGAAPTEAARLAGGFAGLASLTLGSWLLLLAAACLTGLAKTVLPGAATIAVALFAAVLPAKESTGVMLVLLLVGDVLAVWSYRHDADVTMLRRLIPAVAVGVLAGAVFLRLASDTGTRRVIGVVLLLLIAATLWGRRRSARPAPGAAAAAGPADSEGPEGPEGGPSPAPSPGPADDAVGSRSGAGSSPPARALYGALAGFTTMVANAGGPVTSMYFLACRYPVKAFLGTTAWFFFLVNVTKLPFSLSLGIIRPEHLALDAVLAPVVIALALVGRRLADRMDQRVFEPIVIALTILSALPLLR